MTDRRAKFTCLPDGTYEVEGVVYVADEPNVNGVVYPKEVLEKAFAAYTRRLPEKKCLLTIGCKPKPKLANTIGIITEVSIIGAEVRVKAKVLKGTVAVDAAADIELGDLVAKKAAVAYCTGFAFAGSGLGEMDDDGKTVREFEVTSIGIVGVEVVEPRENSDAD